MRPAFLVKLLLLCLMTAAAAHAQESRGTITGTVIDASKALVPGATVTVTNVAMGTHVTAVTNEVGFYNATFLAIGRYSITVKLDGFQTILQQGVTVPGNVLLIDFGQFANVG